MHRGSSPPTNPTDGALWRDSDSKVTFTWRVGRGWQDEGTAAPAPAPKARASCIDCGKPLADPTGKRCRAHYLEHMRGQRPTLAEGGGFTNKAGTHVSMEPMPGIDIPRAESPANPVDQPQAERAAQAEAMMDAETLEAWEDHRIGLPALLVKQPPAPELPSTLPSMMAPPPAPKPRAPAPEPQPPKVSLPHEREAPHPILERHARKAPEDPLAKPRHRPAPPVAGFSPEFMAKLQRVRDGAGIVEIRPISRPVDEAVGGASSLNFI